MNRPTAWAVDDMQRTHVKRHMCDRFLMPSLYLEKSVPSLIIYSFDLHSLRKWPTHKCHFFAYGWLKRAPQPQLTYITYARIHTSIYISNNSTQHTILNIQYSLVRQMCTIVHYQNTRIIQLIELKEFLSVKITIYL